MSCHSVSMSLHTKLLPLHQHASSLAPCLPNSLDVCLNLIFSLYSKIDFTIFTLTMMLPSYMCMLHFHKFQPEWILGFYGYFHSQSIESHFGHEIIQVTLSKEIIRSQNIVFSVKSKIIINHHKIMLHLLIPEHTEV